MIEAGIMQYVTDGVMRYQPGKAKRVDDKIPPQVLTIDDLEVGFVICLSFGTLSLIVFLAEVLVNKTLRLIKKLRECIIAKSLMEAFFRMKRH